MMRKPRLLVVDDLVAGLGELAKAEVVAMLHDIADRGVALLMMSVDSSDLGRVDRIWSLSGGRLTGPPPPGRAEVVELRPSERGRPA
jgi:ABC-type sugar transport system ATPase subunit